jgi:hypothetical protein
MTTITTFQQRLQTPEFWHGFNAYRRNEGPALVQVHVTRREFPRVVEAVQPFARAA